MQQHFLGKKFLEKVHLEEQAMGKGKSASTHWIGSCVDFISRLDVAAERVKSPCYMSYTESSAGVTE
jgi:hypothetical protein